MLHPPDRGTPLPGLVLLHGLGEWNHEGLGLRAQPELYGVAGADARLRAPPVSAARPRPDYFTLEHQARLNRSLARRPYRGLVLICPTTPNPFRQGSTAVERFGDWLLERVLPEVRTFAPLGSGPGAVGVDGCSMGGAVALELFTRRPGRWGSLGVVQAAFSAASARDWARRLGRAVELTGHAVPMRLGTSSQDPYRDAHRALHRELDALGLPSHYAEQPGPHDQPWLREIGSLDMLYWHDRWLWV